MRNSFVQSMAWLHTWAGLIVGWVLFAIFFGGSLACFDKELDYWMRPTLQRVDSRPTSMDAAAATLRRLAPHADILYLHPPSARDPSIHGFAFEPGKSYIAPVMRAADGALVPDTVGGEFFYTLHYNLQAGMAGVYLVGLAGMLMLVALVSGIIIHRRIFKDIFVFRPRSGGQRAWLDGHNITGVLGLPFHLMIAYTGVAIMVSSYMLAGVQIGYRGNTEQFFAELGGKVDSVVQHRPPSRIASLEPIMADAVRRFGGPVLYLRLDHVHDASMTVSALAAGDDRVAGGRHSVVYDGVDGHFLSETAPPPAAYRVYQFLSGLHRVQFGGAPFRWLYFLLGGAGCVMLASGMRVWVEKRSRQFADAGLYSGYGLVRALNIGVVAGMPLASVGLLWLNRLLPADLAERGGWEARGFCAIWILAALWGLLRLNRGRPWRELFAATAALSLTLPLLNALCTPRSSLLSSLVQRQWALAGVDLAAVGLGLGFCWLAWMAGRPPRSRRSGALREQPRARRTAASHDSADSRAAA